MTMTMTMTRSEMIATIGTDTTLWSARCRAEDGDEGDTHALAWSWLRGGSAEEGIEIVRGSVRVVSPGGTVYRVTA